MRIVLGERPNAHDAVQRTRWLIPVTRSKLRHPHRQITIAFQALLENLHMARAVHRLQRQRAVIFRFCREHGFPEFLPVARCFPECAVDELRRFHLEIFRSFQALPHISFALAIQRPAFGVPEN